MKKQDLDGWTHERVVELEKKVAELRKKAAAVDAATPLWREVGFGILIGLFSAGLFLLVIYLAGGLR